MKMMRGLMATTVSAALVAGSAMPAAAQSYPYGYGKPGYGHGYGRYRHRHHHRGVSAGDVIAGVAVIGVLAAIASAASKRRGDTSRIDGEDRAADACAVRAEQRFGDGARARIEDVRRTRDGYSVRGALETRDRGYDDHGYDDRRFTCDVRFGRVDDIRFDEDYAARGF